MDLRDSFKAGCLHTLSPIVQHDYIYVMGSVKMRFFYSAVFDNRSSTKWSWLIWIVNPNLHIGWKCLKKLNKVANFHGSLYSTDDDQLDADSG